MVYCKGFHRRVLSPVFLALGRRYLAADDLVLRAFELHHTYYQMLDAPSYNAADLVRLDCAIDAWREAEMTVMEEVVKDDTIKPKAHYTAHYSDEVEKVGCLLHYRCYGMESFHQTIIGTWAASNKVNFPVNVLNELWHQWGFYLKTRARNIKY